MSLRSTVAPDDSMFRSKFAGMIRSSMSLGCISQPCSIFLLDSTQGTCGSASLCNTQALDGSVFRSSFAEHSGSISGSHTEGHTRTVSCSSSKDDSGSKGSSSRRKADRMEELDRSRRQQGSAEEKCRIALGFGFESSHCRKVAYHSSLVWQWSLMSTVVGRYLPLVRQHYCFVGLHKCFEGHAAAERELLASLELRLVGR